MKNEEWKEYKLGEVTDSCLGKMLDAKKNKGAPQPYLANVNVRWGSFDLEDLPLMRFEDDENERYGLKYGDVVICEGGEPGRCAIWKDQIPNMKIQKALHRVRCHENLDYRYLYYYLLWAGKKGLLEAYFTGTTIKHLPGDKLKIIPIRIPSLATQKEIANILSALDDKIELNNAINRNLEEQAQAIFKNWFVDFAPFGGEMPEDWTIGKLSDIADITMGQSPDGKSYNEDGVGTVFYQGRAEFGWRFPTRRLFTTAPSRMAKMNDTLMSVRAPVGDLNIANEDCCIGRGLAAIHSKNNHQSFVHYTIVALKPKLDIYNGEGTVFGCINRDSLNNMPIIIPSNSFIDQFESIISFFDTIIFQFNSENQNLIKIRDEIIYKLFVEKQSDFTKDKKYATSNL